MRGARRTQPGIGRRYPEDTGEETLRALPDKLCPG
jgi:hypothetical protein